MSPRLNPPPNLNPLARLYCWMEWFTFGPALDRCRRVFLPELLASRRALALGDGDGRFTARLLHANLRVRIDAIDASSAMLRQLLRRAGSHASRVHAHCVDARLWQPSEPPYDLVFAHFFLDFLTPDEVLSLARRLRPAVSPSALWAVSEFVVPPTLFGRFFARPIVAALYRAFGLLTGLKVRRLPDHPRALTRAGFTLLRRRTLLRGLLVSELWQPCPVPASRTWAESPSESTVDSAEVLQMC